MRMYLDCELSRMGLSERVRLAWLILSGKRFTLEWTTGDAPYKPINLHRALKEGS